MSYVHSLVPIAVFRLDGIRVIEDMKTGNSHLNFEIAMKKHLEFIGPRPCVPDDKAGLQILTAQGHRICETKLIIPFGIGQHVV